MHQKWGDNVMKPVRVHSRLWMRGSIETSRNVLAGGAQKVLITFYGGLVRQHGLVELDPAERHRVESRLSLESKNFGLVRKCFGGGSENRQKMIQNKT